MLSSDIEIGYQPDESNVFVTVHNRSRQVGITSSGVFETWVNGNAATYAIDATEAGGGGTYYATFPAAMAPGLYTVKAYQGAKDGTASYLGFETVQWNGTVLVQDINIALETTISDPDPDGSSSDLTFVLTAGSLNDDEYNNMVVAVIDASGNVTASRRVSGYVGNGSAPNRKVTVDESFEFPLAVGDLVIIWADTYSQTAGAAAADQIAARVWQQVASSFNADGTMGELQNEASATHGRTA